MPVQYSSIVDEHQATRQAIGLFDISHMGRFRFDGERAASFLDHLVTRRVSDLSVGQIRYGLIVNEQGGILDDVLVYRLKDGAATYHAMVVNAGNVTKIKTWIEQQLGDDDGVRFQDMTHLTAMIAVQGPAAIGLVNPLVNIDVAGLKYYHGTVCEFAGIPVTCSRTGYTGEDGCELVVPADAAETVWQTLMDAGQPHGLKAAGLGARDTLRLEAGMPLYGHELTEEIHPYQAGLTFAVNLKDRDFIGRDALVKAHQDKTHDRRVGLRLMGKRVPREQYPITDGQHRIGTVTSGTFSPTLQIPIAMGYVRPEHSEVGTEVCVDLRGRPEPAVVCQLPFYERASQTA